MAARPPPRDPCRKRPPPPLQRAGHRKCGRASPGRHPSGRMLAPPPPPRDATPSGRPTTTKATSTRARVRWATSCSSPAIRPLPSPPPPPPPPPPRRSTRAFPLTPRHPHHHPPPLPIAAAAAAAAATTSHWRFSPPVELEASDRSPPPRPLPPPLLLPTAPIPSPAARCPRRPTGRQPPPMVVHLRLARTARPPQWRTRTSPWMQAKTVTGSRSRASTFVEVRTASLTVRRRRAGHS